MRRFRTATVVVCAVAALLLAGCSGGSADTEASAASATTAASTTTAATTSTELPVSPAGSSGPGGESTSSSAAPAGGDAEAIVAELLRQADEDGFEADQQCLEAVVAQLAPEDAAKIAGYYADPSGGQPELSPEADALGIQLTGCRYPSGDPDAGTGAANSAATSVVETATSSVGPLDDLCGEYAEVLADSLGPLGTVSARAYVDTALVADKVVSCRWYEAALGSVEVFVAHYDSTESYAYNHPVDDPLGMGADGSLYFSGDEIVAKYFDQQWEFQVYVDGPKAAIPVPTLQAALTAIGGVDPVAGTAAITFVKPSGGNAVPMRASTVSPTTG